MKVPAQANTVVRFEISPRSIAWILATIVGVWLFLQLRAIVLLLVVALVFAYSLANTFLVEAHSTERGGIVTRRVLLAALLIAAFWGLQSQIQGKDRPPESELVILYHSDTKGEIEECG